MSYRTHTCGQLRVEDEGKEVMLSGWVHRRRDLGGLVFVDLRDRYGLTQIVFHPDTVKDFSVAEKLKYEFVVRVTGKVGKREEGRENKDVATGDIELIATDVEILSEAQAMPFEIFETNKGQEDEELRLKYRFLEIRRERLKENLLFRAKMETHIRGYMERNDFVNVATPILTVSSPEGARDFLVPSRLHPGKFYALPQAPQQYKQLLMVGGMDRYYQIAPCMRDEDPRADRSPGEFYQLDCETSFLTQDEFFELMEPLFYELTEDLAGKKVKSKPFPRIPYIEIMETYGSDRPDLRYDLKLTNVTDWANKTGFHVFQKAEYVRALVIPGGGEYSRKVIEDELEDAAKRAHAKGLAWMKMTTDTFEGGIAKFFKPEEFDALTELVHMKPGDLICFVADKWKVSCEALGAVRHLVGKKMKLADENEIAWAWVVDFPFYEERDEEKISATGGPASGWDFAHNPFSMPQGGMDALVNQDPLDIRAFQYDIIANGLELSSGGVRNKDPEIMYKAFEIAGYDKSVVDKKFGHMIKAFSYGAPPHCGFAPGIERLVMLLRGEDNIRAVVPFPKNQKAEEPMVGSPAEVDESQLKDLGLQIVKKDE